MSRITIEGVGMTSKRTRDRLVQRLVEQGIKDQRVLDIMANTPRHLFLDEALSHRAYEDTALPIGYGQTLSQPYIVARMTELLLGNGRHLERVLEIGTGSGYQTTVLAQLVEKVWSVERIKPLQDKARRLTRKLGLSNVYYRHADGCVGWPENGLYDGILSAAAPREVPKGLLAQLRPNGVLVIPIGAEKQMLTVIERDGETDEFTTRNIEPVRFVPLLSGITR